jgi:deoxyhypusine synthase
MNIRPAMTVGQLVREMRQAGVLGAGRIARAVSIMLEMAQNPSYTVFFTMAGPMVPGGLRDIIRLLIEQNIIDVLVTSGANLVHDLIEALGYPGRQATFPLNDHSLRTQGIGRAGDILFEQEGFEALDQTMRRILTSISDSGVTRISPSQLFHKIGETLPDDNSLLKTATQNNVPIFVPGILDSMIGLHLWMHDQITPLELDPISDLHQLSDIVYDADKVGAIILGGGLPKHHALGVNILRDGVDAAIQVTMDRPETGSFSGAPLSEAISWKKIQTTNKVADVIGDATIVFPIIVAAVIEQLQTRKDE